LCGNGVTSSMLFTVIPADCRAVMALSRPLPGPFTRTSTSFTPNFAAFSAACCEAHWPAKGVLLRLPLKPQVPALAQQSVSPLVSVIVTVVLLNVALMCATPSVTLRRTLRRFVFATDSIPYFRSLTPFLPATVFFGPFRVRALVRVR
jgi:hypothetical protein